MTPWTSPESDAKEAWLVGGKAIAAAYMCGFVVIAAALLTPGAKRALGADWTHLDDRTLQWRAREARQAPRDSIVVTIPVTYPWLLPGYKQHDDRGIVMQDDEFLRATDTPGKYEWVPGQKVEWVKVRR